MKQFISSRRIIDPWVGRRVRENPNGKKKKNE